MPLSRRSLLAGLAAPALAGALGARPVRAASILRIGYQRSSTLIALLRQDGSLEKALAPLGTGLSWHEFTSGLPIMEALNAGQIDVSADVADTVPVFAQAAGARITYIAQEAASPEAQAILVPKDSPAKSVADLKGRRVAVTKGAGSHFLLLAALAEAGLSFKDIAPAYLTPADGRAALTSGGVEAWVAWDPFLSAARQQTGARVLRDGSGLSLYKRYYLASDAYVAANGPVLGVLFARLAETGAWVKANPAEAAARLAPLWKIEADVVETANARRSYRVEPVTRDGLAEQQKIADAFRAEGLLPRPVDTAALGIWAPTARRAAQ
ncbi:MULTISPECIES: aliphatic sulfonate ABC transporter substrate-binding protein [Methylobacterium]|uniref:Aliphatic sulfonates-binding protein n=1 Tax=Methylobacterium jeotgali TaxID=381630 RepID=A0ABQ4T0B3_9HYPH|nr:MULTISPECIES: aliphatic sulfonate ABC transporter substrate-binding protein [Methylobacterium]PIU05699.1 MAG: aliphatic sulfonate ABC transporter substrate-binding protein [Methylobacterium sp. CG09_land_8_20_14_0_10_71_15]PIU12409.1 MAG: aliphatic sulfonate ABC transporter substrate-binding protein [Methylobacterium sp. CG08_land_8_20_14_0_20_71_15]GJE08894.1 Putative aliphatic sulfonates-binding protein [Methylobacterium jeotgali]